MLNRVSILSTRVLGRAAPDSVPHRNPHTPEIAMITPSKLLNLVLPVAMAASASAATLIVDGTGVESGIGAAATGSRVRDITPAGVLGWANWTGGSLTPQANNGATGGTIITLSQIGASTATIDTVSDNRYRQQWGATVTATDSDVLSTRTTTNAVNSGFRYSLTPGAVGTYDLYIHLGEFGASAVNYTVSDSGGNFTAFSGAISQYATGTAYDEGFVKFTFTVDNAAEATSTWNFDLTRSTTGAILTGAAYLVPEPSVALLGGLGLLGLLRRRR